MQSNGAMLEMMTSKMTIDLNVLNSLIKTELWAIWIELWLSQFIGVGWEKKTLISVSNQRNQTISLVVDAMTEAEGKLKYQILQKRKTKYHSKFFYFSCRNLIQIPNCRNWREEKIPKQLQRQNRNTKLQKLIPNCRNWREDEIPKQLQRQNRNTKLQKLIPNCRSWKEDEIPKQLQRHNRNTKLQKLKRRWNTKINAETDRNTKLQKLMDSPNTRFCRSGRQNITLIFIIIIIFL